MEPTWAAMKIKSLIHTSLVFFTRNVIQILPAIVIAIMTCVRSCKVRKNTMSSWFHNIFLGIPVTCNKRNVSGDLFKSQIHWWLSMNVIPAGFCKTLGKSIVYMIVWSECFKFLILLMRPIELKHFISLRWRRRGYFFGRFYKFKGETQD